MKEKWATNTFSSSSFLFGFSFYALAFEFLITVIILYLVQQLVYTFFFHSFGSFSVLRQISECKLKLNTFSISQKSEGAKTNYFSQDKQYENNENGPSLLWCEPFALTNSYTYSNIWGHLSFGRKISLHIAQIIRLCSFFFIVLGGYSFLPTLVDVRFLIGSQFFMYWSNVRPSSSWRLQLPLRGHIFS